MEQVETQNRFLDRFVAFFLVEQRLRLKAYLLSVVVTFVYSLVMLFVLHLSERTVAIQASILFCTLVAIFVTRYVMAGYFWKPDDHTKELIFHSWQIASMAAALAASLMGIAAGFNAPKLRGAIVNLKLDFLTAQLDVVSASNLPSDTQLRQRFQEIESTVNSVSPDVPVTPGSLSKTQAAILRVLKQRQLSEQTKEAGWGAAVNLDLFATRRLVGPRTEASPTGYHINSTLEMKNENITLLGGPSTFYLGESILIENSTLIFDKLDLVGDGAGEALVVLDNSRVLVQDAILKNVPQRVDRIVWNNVLFDSVLLGYGGGPIRMQNVTFKNCNLLGLLGHAPLEFVNKIDAAEKTGDSITYAYDP